MKYNPKIHHRRSIRLKGYDYSRPGAYFATICTHNRQCLFGRIADGQMALNNAGLTAVQCWQAIPDHFPHVQLDAFVVMPNHVHGILFIVDTAAGAKNVGAKNFSPLQPANAGAENVRAKDFSPPDAPVRAKDFSPLQPGQRPRGTSKTLGSIIRGFKIGVTKWTRANTKIHDVWQPNYWEHIVRDEPELNRIREYIHNNPARWELDKLHPGRGDGRDGDGRRGETYFAPTKIREPSAIYGRDAQDPDDDEEWEEWMV